ncbi:MAG: hypothetical protein OXM62_05075 [bacterium]|nr:hypothetical protein [bacterium]MDE0234358.1 hypothetical protein [bacterium]
MNDWIVNPDFGSLRPEAPAKRESVASGIVSTDVLSTSRMWYYLALKLRSSAGHLLSLDRLLLSDLLPEQVHNSALAIARCSLEDTTEVLWVLGPDASWETRLRRFSYLYLDSFCRMLENHKRIRKLRGLPNGDTEALEKLRTSIVAWIRGRGWVCANGKSPTAGRWRHDLPDITKRVRDAVSAWGYSPDLVEALYSSWSMPTHGNVFAIDPSPARGSEEVEASAEVAQNAAERMSDEALYRFATWSGEQIDGMLGEWVWPKRQTH